VFVEFTDDLDGFKTSPRLPAKYALLEQQQTPCDLSRAWEEDRKAHRQQPGKSGGLAAGM